MTASDCVYSRCVITVPGYFTGPITMGKILLTSLASFHEGLNYTLTIVLVLIRI